MEKMSLVQDRLAYESRMRSSAHWLYWIAGLSLINTIVLFVGGNINFVFGLGITQIVDAIAYSMIEGFGNIATYIAVAIDVFIACIFITLGSLAVKRKRWAFITGIVLYSLDGLLFFLLSDYLSIIFHIWVIYSLYQGLISMKRLIEVERQMRELWEREQQGTVENAAYVMEAEAEQQEPKESLENIEEDK